MAVDPSARLSTVLEMAHSAELGEICLAQCDAPDLAAVKTCKEQL